MSEMQVQVWYNELDRGAALEDWLLLEWAAQLRFADKPVISIEAGVRGRTEAPFSNKVSKA